MGWEGEGLNNCLVLLGGYSVTFYVHLQVNQLMVLNPCSFQKEMLELSHHGLKVGHVE